MDKREIRSNKKSTFSMVLYILSGIMAVLAIVLVIFVISTAQGIMNNDIFLQLAGIGELARIILQPLRAGLINLGIFLGVIVLAFAAILFIAGRLLARQVQLQSRVESLEEIVRHLSNDGIKPES